jgi:nucleoside 2-deoxyribosyltransferase
MKVYVAASSADREIARKAMAELAEYGIEITLDWTTCDGYIRPYSEEERSQVAFWELQAVRRADLVWVILSEDRSEGASAELGYALGIARIVIVSGPIDQRRYFPLLARQRFESHEDAKAEIIFAHRQWEAHGHG